MSETDKKPTETKPESPKKQQPEKTKLEPIKKETETKPVKDINNNIIKNAANAKTFVPNMTLNKKDPTPAEAAEKLKKDKENKLNQKPTAAASTTNTTTAAAKTSSTENKSKVKKQNSNEKTKSKDHNTEPAESKKSTSSDSSSKNEKNTNTNNKTDNNNKNNTQKQENPPSKVVHLRNLPLPTPPHTFNQFASSNQAYHQANEDVEGEIIKKAFQYGHVVDVLMMRKTGQAFLQMDSLDAGSKFVEAYREKPMDIGTHCVYVQYSKHQELKNIDDNPHQQMIRNRLEDAKNGKFTVKSSINKMSETYPRNPSNNNNLKDWTESGDTKEACGDADINNKENIKNNISNNSNSNNKMNSVGNVDSNGDKNENKERKILHVVIEKDATERDNITIHDYYDLFSKHGKVMRIVSFVKNSGNNHNKSNNNNNSNSKQSRQILIELDSSLAAQTCYSTFNGKNMDKRNEGHTMRIDYSNLPHLTIKQNNNTRWDYERQSRDEARKKDAAEQDAISNALQMQQHHPNSHIHPQFNHYAHPGQYGMQFHPHYAPQFTHYYPTNAGDNNSPQNIQTVAGATLSQNPSSNASQKENGNSGQANVGQTGNTASGDTSTNVSATQLNTNNVHQASTIATNGSPNQPQGNMTAYQMTGNPNFQAGSINQAYNVMSQYGQIMPHHPYFMQANAIAGGHNGHGGNPYDRGIPGITGIPGHLGNPYHIQQHMQALQLSQSNHTLTNQQNQHQQHDPRNSQQNQTTPTIGPNGQIFHNPFFQTQQHNQQHYQNTPNTSQVLCASNLDAEIVKPDDLFTLFGVYGDVQRVKILYEKRDTALIEFHDCEQAGKALKFLNGRKLYGKELKIRVSKFEKVNMPKQGADTYQLTKEFINHPLHRYRKQGSKNFQNIYEPCDVLHLSNIPEGKTEEEITSIFKKHGNVKQFKFFKDSKMALIKLDSIEEAISCLIKLHNKPMSSNQHLRVSFSKGYLS
jgi:hypothetical protein